MVFTVAVIFQSDNAYLDAGFLWLGGITARVYP